MKVKKGPSEWRGSWRRGVNLGGDTASGEPTCVATCAAFAFGQGVEGASSGSCRPGVRPRGGMSMFPATTVLYQDLSISNLKEHAFACNLIRSVASMCAA